MLVPYSPMGGEVMYSICFKLLSFLLPRYDLEMIFFCCEFYTAESELDCLIAISGEIMCSGPRP